VVQKQRLSSSRECIFEGSALTTRLKDLTRFGQVPPLFDIVSHSPFTGGLKKLEKAVERMLITRENDAGGANTDLASHLVNLHIIIFSSQISPNIGLSWVITLTCPNFPSQIAGWTLSLPYRQVITFSVLATALQADMA